MSVNVFRLTTFSYLFYAKRWHWYCLSWETTCSWNILKISSLNLQRNGFTFQSHLSNTFKSLKSSLKRCSRKWQNDVKFCFALYNAHFIEHFKVSQIESLNEMEEGLMWRGVTFKFPSVCSFVEFYHSYVSCYCETSFFDVLMPN